jgi:hypothetical protein
MWLKVISSLLGLLVAFLTALGGDTGLVEATLPGTGAKAPALVSLFYGLLTGGGVFGGGKLLPKLKALLGGLVAPKPGPGDLKAAVSAYLVERVMAADEDGEQAARDFLKHLNGG